MSRGQVVSRQLLIIGSWVALLLILILVFVLPKFFPTFSTGTTAGVASDLRAPMLSAFLREPVQLSTSTGVQTVTRAEALAVAFIKDDEAAAEQLTLPFISLVKSSGTAKQASITITATWRGKSWKSFGDTITLAPGVRQTGVNLPLPNGQEFRVEYREVP